MSFKLTYATMFNPPEELHARFEAALARVRARLGASHATATSRAPTQAARESTATSTTPRIAPSVLGRFAAASARRCRRGAARGARRAGPRWKRTPAHERARLLRRVGQLLEERVYDIAASLTLEVGKNRMEALGEAQEAADFFATYCDDFERARRFRARASRRSAHEPRLAQPQRAQALRRLGGDHALQLPHRPRRRPRGRRSDHRQHRGAERGDRDALGGTPARRLHPRRGAPARCVQLPLRLERCDRRGARRACARPRESPSPGPTRSAARSPSNCRAAPTRSPASRRWVARTPASSPRART